jgi:DNA-binding Lrp family transcriptional regulator
VDDLDEAVVRLLEIDGRLAYGVIAKRIGLSRAAVSARAHRLIHTAQLEVRGAVHPAVLGQHVLGYATIEVRESAAMVARHVASRTDVPFVSVVTGRRSVVAELRCTTAAAFQETLDHIRSHEFVTSVTTLVYDEIVRDVVGPVGALTATIDAVDLELIRYLQVDGRITYVDLASRVGLTPAGVRRRVLALIDGKVLRVGATVRLTGRDHYVVMDVGVRVSKSREQVAALIAHRFAPVFTALTTGDVDILMTLRGLSIEQLSNTVDAIRSVPGVEYTDTWMYLNIVKEDYVAPVHEAVDGIK